MKLSFAQPLIFEPLFKERIWGGRQLEKAFDKKLPPGKRIGESWEISDRPGDASVIAVSTSMAAMTMKSHLRYGRTSWRANRIIAGYYRKPF